ncbi:TIGR01777 family oxidoreductase [Vibrio parahaemolyticus]|nr:TIGR01777 family oxidoreductase [Vibrio parahaemolyticus]
MKILLTGGTGFIGSELLKLLTTHHVVLLTRSPQKAKQQLQHADVGNIEYIDSLDQLADLNHIDAIINLAGEPIADKRWTQKQKDKICKSRWKITEQIVELIHASTKPPSVFISGSAVGYYGDQQEHPFDECLHVNSEAFTHLVCEKWEQIAKRAESEDTRVCLLRTGVVLGPNGGALAKMLLPYKLGLGGPLGNGKQYLPLDSYPGHGACHHVFTEYPSCPRRVQHVCPASSKQSHFQRDISKNPETTAHTIHTSVAHGVGDGRISLSVV